MSRALLALALSLAALPAAASGQITIEKATIPWSELERLLGREGTVAPSPRAAPAPHAFAVPSAEISGTIEEGQARLTVRLEVQVLAERWTALPILPSSLAVSRAELRTPPDRRAFLVSDGPELALVAEGAGNYRLDLDVEGPLEVTARGLRLAITPAGLASGKARLVLRDDVTVKGRTAWRTSPAPGGGLLVEAALGAGGVELLLGGAAARAAEAGATLEELEALTVLSLGGSGITRIVVNATPADGAFEVVLPKTARLFRAYAGGVPFQPAAVVKDDRVRLPLKGPAQVELAYTFEAPPIGIRGRYRVELPRFSVAVRQARWGVWLPEGLVYRETQAALTPVGSCAEGATVRARTALTPQGRSFCFSRAVLEPGKAYVEGSYAQAL